MEDKTQVTANPLWYQSCDLGNLYSNYSYLQHWETLAQKGELPDDLQIYEIYYRLVVSLGGLRKASFPYKKRRVYLSSHRLANKVSIDIDEFNEHGDFLGKSNFVLSNVQGPDKLREDMESDALVFFPNLKKDEFVLDNGHTFVSVRPSYQSTEGLVIPVGTSESSCRHIAFALAVTRMAIQLVEKFNRVKGSIRWEGVERRSLKDRSTACERVLTTLIKHDRSLIVAKYTPPPPPEQKPKLSKEDFLKRSIATTLSIGSQDALYQKYLNA